MQVALLTIGDEILIGQIVDTNSAWMGKELNDIGLGIGEIVSIGDNKEAILSSLERLHTQFEIVLITGGLGPTRDDITKQTLAEYFNSTLILNEEIESKIEAYYARRKRDAKREVIEKMAMVPDNCEVLINEKGTAASMWFAKDGKVVISMPGVPYEMKDMMKRIILPRIKAKFAKDHIAHRTILTAGTGETVLAEEIRDIEDGLPSNVKLAYLPSLGTVRVRLSAKGEAGLVDSQLETIGDSIKTRLSRFVFGEGEAQLEEIVGSLLVEKGATLGIAESCTGGFISHLISRVPGASRYYKGSIVSYAYETKETALGVGHDTLANFGAVSEETVKEMALGALKNLEVDYAISVSGIAGPGGGLPDKPVGTVWFALADKNRLKTKLLNLASSREINIPLASNLVLSELRRFILG